MTVELRDDSATLSTEQLSFSYGTGYHWELKQAGIEVPDEDSADYGKWGFIVTDKKLSKILLCWDDDEIGETEDVTEPADTLLFCIGKMLEKNLLVPSDVWYTDTMYGKDPNLKGEGL